MGTVWERFEHDPRRPDNAPLRASDRDRDVVQELLGTAYAEGRLTREELDERADQVAASKTLGELPPLVSDLVSTAPTTRVPMTVTERHETAEVRYRRMRQGALTAFLTPTLICWAIWAFGGMGFPWPVFVTIVTGMRWVQLFFNKQDTIASIEQDLQKRERKRLEQQDRRDRRQIRGRPFPPASE